MLIEIFARLREAPIRRRGLPRAERQPSRALQQVLDDAAEDRATDALIRQNAMRLLDPRLRKARVDFAEVRFRALDSDLEKVRSHLDEAWRSDTRRGSEQARFASPHGHRRDIRPLERTAGHARGLQKRRSIATVSEA